MNDILPNWVTRQAQRRPEAPAVVFQQECISYGRLEETSNRLAHMLLRNGCQPGDTVGLLLPKSPAAIAGILGILKAGCAYVPLDPLSPARRLAKVFETCENEWVLAAGTARERLEELQKAQFTRKLRIGWLDERPPRDATLDGYFEFGFCLDDLLPFSGEPPGIRNASLDPAYIMFTSGSTGNPKGVVITHSNVVHFVEWALSYFGIAEGERLSCHSPLHFDLSVFDIFGAFAAGAELHLVPPELNVLPNKLGSFIRDSQLTQWFSVPSILNYMAKFDVVAASDFPALKRLLWCGEVLPVPVLAYWMQRLPHVTFTNLYGPTEATIASSYYTVPKRPEDLRAEIPIGSPCGGEQLYVLDEYMQPVNHGEVGDLYIQGAGLSPGYYKDPERTRAVFVRNPFSSEPSDRLYKTGDLARVGEDGLVYFVGRADTQVKSRGYRIELGEIAAALNALGTLREAAVVAVPSNGFEGTAICCAYVSAPRSKITPALLRTELSRVLPAYMLPSRWMALEELPKNANGKTDTARLKEQFLHVEQFS
jgi:amino acid adenylation domain-containing protein